LNEESLNFDWVSTLFEPSNEIYELKIIKNETDLLDSNVNKNQAHKIKFSLKNASLSSIRPNLIH